MESKEVELVLERKDLSTIQEPLITLETVERLCRHLESGQTVESFCEMHVLPRRELKAFIANNKQAKELYNTAKENFCEALADQTLKIADEIPQYSEGSTRCIDKGYVMWQQLRINQRMKLLAAICPEKYSPRKISDNNVNITLESIVSKWSKSSVIDAQKV